MTDYRLGVDIGGTKIAAGVVDSAGAVVDRARVATPRTGGNDVMDAVLDVVARLMRDYQDAAAIGVGAPGVIDRNAGVVVSATEVLPGWAGTDVAGPLTATTHLPVAVDNDVRAAGLGEARYGLGADYRRILLVSLGTGVGGALVDHGALQHGSHGTAGEIAHVLAPANGPIACGCGRYDHLESHCCGPAITAAYHAATAATGDSVPLPEIVNRARAGDETAGHTITAAAELAGRALAGLVCAVDVDAVILAGGVAQIGAEILGPLRRAFAESALPALAKIPVDVGALGTDAPLVGAAALATDAIGRHDHQSAQHCP